MSITVPIALFGWIPLVLGLFWLLPPRRAVVTAFLIGWLFLPMAGYKLEGLPSYDKFSVIGLAVFLGLVLFDFRRLTGLRVHWVDLPMAIWCICPMFSCLTSGLTTYDAVSAMLTQIIVWGLPYVIGRAYFSDLPGLHELAVGIFIAGLVYVPLCLYEIRMSPQLHSILYGFHQHDWGQSKRYGGWRPTVFMQHGLAVAFWMTSAAVAGLWLVGAKVVRHVCNLPAKWLLATLLITTILCKSGGALVLLGIAVAAYLLVRWTRSPVPILCLLLASPLYMALRSTGLWSGDQLVAISQQSGLEERADSLKFRLDSEDVIMRHVWERPLFGWGWTRFTQSEEMGQKDAITDGLWVWALGRNGFVGLAALTAIFLLPVGLLIRRYPAEEWTQPAVAPAAALAVVLCLHMIDNLTNGMINPVLILAAGGLAGMVSAAKSVCWPISSPHVTAQPIRSGSARQP